MKFPILEYTSNKKISLGDYSVMFQLVDIQHQNIFYRIFWYPIGIILVPQV